MPAWLRPWIVPLIALEVIVALAWSWNREHAARVALARTAEEAKAEAARLGVVQQAGARDLSTALAVAQELQGQLADARKALGEVKPVEIVKWVTVPAAASGSPRPAPGGGSPPCLLAAGDSGEVRVSEARLEGKAGARVLIASAEAWRLTPTASRLFGGPVSTPVPLALTEAVPAPPRWGAGVYVGAARDGWTVGPAVAFPPIRIWGLSVEATGGVGLGPTGAVQAGGSGIVRW